MAESVQRLAEGKPLDERFTDLGVPSSVPATKPTKMLGMVSGLPGSGKTSLLLSCPDLFLLNLDGTTLPTIHPDQYQRVWPGLDEQGHTISETGRRFDLSWETLQQKVNALVARAKANKPRPETVGIDTMAALTQLGMDYIVRNSNKDNWRDLHGQTAYDSLYGYILKTIHSLKDVGYGVMLSCHIANKEVYITEEEQQEVPKLTMFPGLWSRLNWQLEASLVILRETVSEVTVRQRGDKEISVPTGRKVETRVITATRKRYDGIARSKTPIGDIRVFPKDQSRAWSMLEEAFQEGLTTIINPQGTKESST